MVNLCHFVPGHFKSGLAKLFDSFFTVVVGL